MLAIILYLFRFVRLVGSGHQAVAVENLALRLQLVAFKRKRKRAVLTRLDRLFWVGSVPGLEQLAGRTRFRSARIQSSVGSGSGFEDSGPGCLNPSWASEEDPLSPPRFDGWSCRWRPPMPSSAPRIHRELKMLGIRISERTVLRILRSGHRPGPSQTWKTFLRNHLGQIVPVDFFTVPTIRLRVLFVFLVLEHRRREVLHFNVTDHPTSGWVGQQIVEAFADREAPRYLIRDRDGVYGNEVRRRLQSLKDGPACVPLA
jgi:putative transposase